MAGHLKRRLIDCLAHLDELEREPDGSHLEQLADASGARELITSTVRPSAFDQAHIDDARALGLTIHPGAGWHPAEIQPQAPDGVFLDEQARLEELVDQGALEVISECGLDRRAGMPELADQVAALRPQLTLAQRTGLPVVVHAVRAVGPLLTLLDEIAAQIGPMPAWIAHGFTGPPEVLAELVRRGAVVGFGPALLSPRAKRGRASAEAAAAGTFVVESDLPSHPPSAIHDVVELLADIRGEPADELAAQTAETARTLLAGRRSAC